MKIEHKNDVEFGTLMIQKGTISFWTTVSNPILTSSIPFFMKQK